MRRRCTGTAWSIPEAYRLEASNDYAGGVEAFDRLMGLAQPPTAIVAPTDVIAIGMLHAAQRRGLRVPQDVSVSGFDDIPVAAVSVPALTTVRMPTEAMVRAAVDLVIAADEETADFHPVLEPELVVRASTGPVPEPAAQRSLIVSSYVIGVDFGTESGRAVVIDTADGRELGSSVYPYSNGVIDETLPAPDDDVRLAPEWALQDPDDYLRTFSQAVPAAIAAAGVDAADVIGVGVDFTACTMLPAKADGTPLAALPQFRRNPHAWVKLWKHHAAQPEADRINAVARERGEDWLPRYGGKISSEWFYSKALQILDEAPDVYDAADRLIEAADWVIWRLTGVESRNSCTAGYKAIWSKSEGFPGREYFAALDPRFADVVDTKMSREVASIGQKAGELTEEAAAWMGLQPGTAVAVANVDAHVSVPATTVTEPGRMVIVMGTSNCHMVLGETIAAVEGMCGVVEDGILPGLFGYEAGQSGVGDIFAWFVDNLVPAEYFEQARARGHRRPRCARAGGCQAGPGAVGTGRARLDERKPLGARRCRPLRGDPGCHAGDQGARGLPRAHRGHRLRDAHDHRVTGSRRRAGQRHRRLRRAAGPRTSC